MRSRISTAIVLSLALLGSTGKADFVTSDATTGILSYTFPARTAGFSRSDTDTRTASLVFAKFNPSLGTLQSADLTFTASGSGSVIGALTSARSFPTGVNANLGITFTLTPTGSGQSLAASIANTSLNQTITVPAGQTGYSIPLGTAGAGPSTLVFNTSYFNTLTGTGTFSMPLSMSFVEETTSSGSSINYQFGSQTRVDATIRYVYAIPEPSSLFLLAVGGMVLAARRISWLNLNSVA